MRNETIIACGAAFAILVALPAPAGAGEPSHDPQHPRFAAGAFVGAGMADAIYEGEYHYELRPRLAFDGGVYFIHRLSDAFAYDVGLELVDKGCVLLDNPLFEGSNPLHILYLELPVGVKLFFGGFAIGIAIAVDFAVYKRFTDESINEWGGYKRVNLCPRLALEYRFPLHGPVSGLVGVAGSMEALDSADTMWGEDESRYRNVNVMLHLGVEVGFGN